MVYFQGNSRYSVHFLGNSRYYVYFLGNFRPTLRRIKQQKQTFILIDVPTDILHEVLKQAQQIGLMSSEQNFIINNLDMHTVDLEPFMYSGTNISGKIKQT